MKNKTMYFRTPKDKEHPFCVFDAQLWNLPNDEMLIMLAILSNKTEDSGNGIWVLNSSEIMNRLNKGGMGNNRFKKCLANLQKKGYLVKERIQGGVLWKVYENPTITLNVAPKTNIQRAPKIKKNIEKDLPKLINDIPYEEMTERQRLIWKANNEK